MKLNNKGFAITAVLYGLLILFVVLVSSYLLVLSAKKDRVDTLVNEIEKEYTNYDVNQVILAEHITKLYNDATKTIVINNNVEYQYAESVSLMNDRLGGSVGNDDSEHIRYYGISPNNYIYFNCKKYPNYNCEKWRIIGVFDGKVKIVKNSIIGYYEWDANGNNDWRQATLKTLLNEADYYTELQSNNSKTIDLISSSTWYINGYDTPEVTLEDMYQFERTGDHIWDGNIALLYPSDYGYAADLNHCKQKLSNYDECISDNWMTNIFEENTAWLLTTNASDSNYAWNVYQSGIVDNSSYDDLYVDDQRSVIPTLYLNTSLKIDSVGTGTENNPYRIIT